MDTQSHLNSIFLLELFFIIIDCFYYILFKAIE